VCVLIANFSFLGLSYESLKERLPEKVEIACRNGPTSNVVSGAKENVRKFIKRLEKEGVYAIEVPWNCGIPFHSTYLTPASEKLLKHLKRVSFSLVIFNWIEIDVIFYSATIKMMNHRVRKHFVNLNPGKNDQWNDLMLSVAKKDTNNNQLIINRSQNHNLKFNLETADVNSNISHIWYLLYNYLGSRGLLGVPISYSGQYS